MAGILGSYTNDWNILQLYIYGWNIGHLYILLEYWADIDIARILSSHEYGLNIWQLHVTLESRAVMSQEYRPTIHCMQIDNISYLF